jgi:hypothetical protein
LRQPPHQRLAALWRQRLQRVARSWARWQPGQEWAGQPVGGPGGDPRQYPQWRGHRRGPPQVQQAVGVGMACGCLSGEGARGRGLHSLSVARPSLVPPCVLPYRLLAS